MDTHSDRQLTPVKDEFLVTKQLLYHSLLLVSLVLKSPNGGVVIIYFFIIRYFATAMNFLFSNRLNPLTTKSTAVIEKMDFLLS